MSFGLNDSTIDFLIAQSARHPSLRQSAARLLVSIDRPDAVEFVVRTVTESETEVDSDPGDTISPSFIINVWESATAKERLMSVPSRGRLLEVWTDESLRAETRKLAFRLWLTSTEQSIAYDAIRRLPMTGVLRPQIVEFRVRMGDAEVVDSALEFVASEPGIRRQLDLIWCGKTRTHLAKQLELLRDSIPQDYSGGHDDMHWDLSRVLLRIPVKDAETLVSANWDHLQYSPLYVSTALYLGTELTVALADASLANCSDISSFLRHIIYHWLSAGVRVEPQHLDTLVPYLTRLDSHVLSQLAELCDGMGEAGATWRRECLFPIREDLRAHYAPTLEELFTRLDQLSTDADISIPTVSVARRRDGV